MNIIISNPVTPVETNLEDRHVESSLVSWSELSCLPQQTVASSISTKKDANDTSNKCLLKSIACGAGLLLLHNCRTIAKLFLLQIRLIDYTDLTPSMNIDRKKTFLGSLLLEMSRRDRQREDGIIIIA